MSQNTLNPCVVPQQDDLIEDAAPSYCQESPCDDPSLRKVPGLDSFAIPEDCSRVDGVYENCDPFATGQIVNDPERPNPDVLYRYAKGVRGCHEAMRDMFTGLVVLDEDGKAHPVPIIWGSQERAVQALLQDNVRQDSTVVDRIKLPIMAIIDSGYNYNKSRYIYHGARQWFRERVPSGQPSNPVHGHKGSPNVYGVSWGIPIDISYTLYAWTLFYEDMTQILDQIFTKFSPVAYIRVRGVQQQIGVELTSIGNTSDKEPGDKKERVIKFEFGLTAETYIPQPIARKKTVLKTRIDFLDGLSEEDSSAVISRIEEVAKENNYQL